MSSSTDSKSGKAFVNTRSFSESPFIPADEGIEGREFIALFTFTAEGDLLEALIDDFGPRAKMNDDAHEALLIQRRADLGPITYGRIEIAPFKLSKYGTDFGLIVSDDDASCVEMQPGGYMVFYTPWTSGKYDS